MGQDFLWNKDIDQNCNQIYHSYILSGNEYLEAGDREIMENFEKKFLVPKFRKTLHAVNPFEH